MKTIAVLMLACLLAIRPVAAQGNEADVWRTFAQQLAVGSRIKVALTSGQRVTATLVQAAPDQLILQPVTRLPVPVQRVGYDQITSIERDQGRGASAAKAAAIGVGAGVGTFFGLMLIFVALLGD